MDRDRIRRIGIDDDEIISAVRLLREGEAGIADHRLQARHAARYVAEILRIACRVDHGLVDLEEGPALAGLGGAGERARSDADRRDLQRRALALAHRADGLTDAAILVIV